jgi:hypothetical protein
MERLYNDGSTKLFTITNKGLHISLPLASSDNHWSSAVLAYSYARDTLGILGLRLHSKG